MEQNGIIILICDDIKFTEYLGEQLFQYKFSFCKEIGEFFDLKIRKKNISHFIIISSPKIEISSIIEPFLILRYLRYNIPIIISSFLALGELRNSRYAFNDFGITFPKSDVFLRLPFYIDDLKKNLHNSKNILNDDLPGYVLRNKEIIFSCLLKYPNFPDSLDYPKVNSIIETQNLLLSTIIDFEIFNIINDKQLISHKIKNKITELYRNNSDFFEDILKIDNVELPTYLMDKHKELLVLSEYNNFIDKLC